MRTRLLALLLTTALPVLAATPALADSVVLEDPDVPAATADTRAVRVEHSSDAAGDGGKVKVVLSAGTVDYGDRFELWIDTPGAGNPRYFARIYPDSGYGAVVAVTGWGTGGPPACRRWGARLSAGPDQKAVFSVPRTCLGSPDRVRVATRAVYERDGKRVRDWTRGPQRFGPWVGVSPAA